MNCLIGSFCWVVLFESFDRVKESFWVGIIVLGWIMCGVCFVLVVFLSLIFI